jgi:hypothetical protein
VAGELCVPNRHMPPVKLSTGGAHAKYRVAQLVLIGGFDAALRDLYTIKQVEYKSSRDGYTTPD